MYSGEIDTVMKTSGYDLGSKAYLNICNSSPQVNHVRYNSFGNFFEMWTSDGCYWKFAVHPE